MGLELESEEIEEGERSGERRRREKKRCSLLVVVVLRLGLFFVEDVDGIIIGIVRSNEDMMDHYVGLAEEIVDVCDRPRRAGEEPAEF